MLKSGVAYLVVVDFQHTLKPIDKSSGPEGGLVGSKPYANFVDLSIAHPVTVVYSPECS